MVDAVRKLSALLPLALCILIVGSRAEAQSPLAPPTSAKKARDGVGASIVTDGALVFSKPDTTASVLTQLPAGRRARVSTKATRGVDGIFRRIQVGNRVGYILADDVAVGEAAAATAVPAPDKKPQKKEKPKKKANKANEDKKREPMYFTRFIGLLFGQSDFKEDMVGVDTKTAFPIYGLKITGPDILISGPIIDFNFALHLGAPSYYDTYSETRPTGFIVFTDALLVIPVTQAMDSMIYFELGPALVYSQFGVVNSGRLMDLKNLNLGLSMAFGGAYRIEKVALRLEGKYLIEKHSYKSFLASIQYEF